MKLPVVEANHDMKTVGVTELKTQHLKQKQKQKTKIQLEAGNRRYWKFS